MGCICSKGAAEEEDVVVEIEKDTKSSSVQLIAPAPSKKEDHVVVNGESKKGSGGHGEKKGGRNQSKRWTTTDSGDEGRMARLASMPKGAQAELMLAGWPSWLASAAGDAIKGMLPRPAESFERLEKIGQGTYSSVFKARDLETGKFVAMKKVRFTNMDEDSVRFMAREIYILRRLDHPNVMKLEGLVTSRMSANLYLVFEYMEHDLAGLAANRGSVKFTEAQIKCYMQQLFQGLGHCHSRGVLHRDIKGANLLVDNNGVLKIGDFGLATCYQPNQNQPLTSRVVTLWYRAPELLLGATDYGPAIDLWSTGCILAELFAGKPIMPGRTEVEQMHKILKLCGSPSEEYWNNSKLPHASSFKPQHPYDRCVAGTFKAFPSSALSLIDKLLAMEPENRGTVVSALSSEFFTTEPLACDPSSLPKYSPSKEMDVKLRDVEAKKRKAEAVVKGRGPESVRRGSRELKGVQTPEFIAQGQPKTISTSHKFEPQEDSGSGFRIEPPRGKLHNGYSHSNSMIHPTVVGSSWTKNAGPGKNNAARGGYEIPQPVSPPPAHKKENRVSVKESLTGYASKKNRINYSGPLMPPGGNMEEVLKEHERQIQHAVRKARLDKSGTNDNFNSFSQLHHLNQGIY